MSDNPEDGKLFLANTGTTTTINRWCGWASERIATLHKVTQIQLNDIMTVLDATPQPATGDAPEAVTKTGASQTVESHLQINDMSETWDWGPGDWVEHYVKKIGSLRADLATEREAHERTQKAHIKMLGRRIDALADEERYADGLAEMLRKVEWSSIGVGEEGYGPWCEWCGSYKENSGHASDCGRQDTLRAHDARRAEKGAE